MINNPIISQNKSYFDPVWLQIRCFLSKLLRYRWNVTGKTVLIWIISTRRKNRTLSQQESSLWKYTTFDPNWQIKTVTSFGLRLVLKHAISVYQFFWRTAVDKTYFSKLLNRGSPLLFVVYLHFFLSCTLHFYLYHTTTLDDMYLYVSCICILTLWYVIMNHGIIHCVNLDKNFQFLSVFASFANKTFARVNCAFFLLRDILMLCNPLKSNSYMFADCQFYFVKIL